MTSALTKKIRSLRFSIREEYSREQENQPDPAGGRHHPEFFLFLRLLHRERYLVRMCYPISGFRETLRTVADHYTMQFRVQAPDLA